MMTSLEIQAERASRKMSQKEFGAYIAQIMKSERPYTASEVYHWETGRRPVPAAIEATLIAKRWGRMGLQRLYVIGGDGGTIKIGRSSYPEWRCRQLKSDEKRRDLAVLFETYCVDAIEGERIAHQKLAHDRERGEWFKTTPLEAIAAVAAAVYEVNTASVVVFLSDAELADLDAGRGELTRGAYIKQATLKALRHPS